MRLSRTDFLPRYITPRGNPSEHAEMFRSFLAALVQGRSKIAADRAKFFIWLLDAELTNNHRMRYQQVWLRRFFASAPRWETRVRHWYRQLHERASLMVPSNKRMQLTRSAMANGPRGPRS
jgi:hypothetical protein